MSRLLPLCQVNIAASKNAGKTQGFAQAAPCAEPSFPQANSLECGVVRAVPCAGLWRMSWRKTAQRNVRTTPAGDLVRTRGGPRSPLRGSLVDELEEDRTGTVRSTPPAISLELGVVRAVPCADLWLMSWRKIAQRIVRTTPPAISLELGVVRAVPCAGLWWMSWRKTAQRTVRATPPANVATPISLDTLAAWSETPGP